MCAFMFFKVEMTCSNLDEQCGRKGGYRFLLCKHTFEGGNKIEIEVFLPITVRLNRKFLVGELRKSTLHRYTPSSVKWTFSITRQAGSELVRKCARLANIVGEDQCRAAVKGFPRTSRLSFPSKRENMVWHEIQMLLGTSAERRPIRPPRLTVACLCYVADSLDFQWKIVAKSMLRRRFVDL